MNPFDVVIAFICLAFVIRGVWIGLVRQLAFFAALFLGFMAAGRYYGQFADYVVPVVGDRQVAFIVTYLLLFSLTYVGTVLLGMGLKKVISISLLGWFDRLLGAVFGLGKGVFISTLSFMALAAFLSSSNHSFLRHSLVSPYLELSTRIMLSFIQDKEVRARFLPRQPAIPSFLEAVIPSVKK